MLCAQDLIAWTQRLCLDGELTTTQPKRLRDCLSHTAGVISRTSRPGTVNLSTNWRWTKHLINAFD